MFGCRRASRPDPSLPASSPPTTTRRSRAPRAGSCAVTEVPARFEPPRRLLLGPGPSNVHPRVLVAMGRPVIGHLDPETLRMITEIDEMLREVFHTANELTFPISGSG